MLSIVLARQALTSQYCDDYSIILTTWLHSCHASKAGRLLVALSRSKVTVFGALGNSNVIVLAKHLEITFLDLLPVVAVQSLSRVQVFGIPRTAARQASLSFTISWTVLKLMSVETVMPSNHLILCCTLLLLPSILPSIRVFSNESVLCTGGQSIGVSPSASVLPMNIQDRSPLGWTGWISLQSKGLSRVFSNTTVQKHQFFGAQLSLWSNAHIQT